MQQLIIAIVGAALSATPAPEAQADTEPDAETDPKLQIFEPIPDELRNLSGRVELEMALGRDDTQAEDVRVLGGNTEDAYRTPVEDTSTVYRTENSVTEVALARSPQRRPASTEHRVCVPSDEQMTDSVRELRLYENLSEENFASSDPALILSGSGEYVYTTLDPGDSITLVQVEGRRRGERLSLKRGGREVELLATPEHSEICYEKVP